MITQDPEAIYKERIHHIEEQLENLGKKDMTLGIIKLALALAGILGLFRVFSNQALYSLGLFGICFLLFIITAVIHETILGKIKFQKNLETINQNEIRFLHYEFPPGTHKGDEFKNPDHEYSSDLDIFGEKGLYHYLDRATTAMGRNRLAQWLQTQAEAEEIKTRQEAVKELAGKIDVRQTIAGHGLLIDDTSKKLESLYHLLKEPFEILNRKAWTGFIHAWPLITLGALILIFFKGPWEIFLGLFLSQMVINKLFAKKVTHLYNLTYKSYKILRAYSYIIAEIEKENYQSPSLNRLKERLSIDGRRASESIRKFSTLLEWFETRNSSIHFLVNNILMWDLHCVYRLERWRNRAAAYVPQWFEVIGEFEALSGLAALYFNQPHWAMPEIITGGQFQLEASALGHPLISPTERVNSDFAINKDGTGQGNLVIITGPNMAGKSTFLRTVGVNMVLALVGAPVCAAHMKISPLKIYSSMQATDSLDKHMSLFYAELQRLKMILDGISRGEPVFFLIDEMLKGTNALDRQKGAVALLKQVMRNRASGIVATHDLKLAELENPLQWENYPAGITISNYHFDGYIEGDKLLFDYKLKDGICLSFNALVLMRKMGIDI